MSWLQNVLSLLLFRGGFSTINVQELAKPATESFRLVRPMVTGPEGGWEPVGRNIQQCSGASDCAKDQTLASVHAIHVSQPFGK